MRVWPAVALAVLVAASWLGHEVSRVEAELRRPAPERTASYVGSRACRACHPGNYASWHRTFHRSMTQEASSASVLGDFEHGELRYMGVEARMRRDDAGRFVMEFAQSGGGERWRAVIERCVGSRRYQQYLARDGDVYFRLPIAWNVEEQRFMHMNGAFLTPDPVPAAPGAPIERADYDRHVTRWNDNCIFCHNVGANPGLRADGSRFDTRVAELGIACEACHGPASEHVARNRNPLRRFELHARALADRSIVDPRRLSPERSAQVCGHCHGQRMAPDIARVLREGDRYLPGEDLARYSQPLQRDTTQNGREQLFAARFWRDGTPRLTAYEYQGLLASKCSARGALTCTDCHAMHAGDPRGQLRPDRLEDAACTQCHKELAAPREQARHSHHLADGSGARCVACHMPRIVYGLIGVHRSHRIDAPRPTPEYSGRPDACTLCHTDKSRAWAADALRAWTGAPAGAMPRTGAELPASAELLLSGDPIERAVAADALGRDRPAATGAGLPARFGLLLDAMQADDYPAVRSIAWRSLRSLLANRKRETRLSPSAFTATDRREERRTSLARIRDELGADAVADPPPELRALREAQTHVRIFIGE